eukprot:1224459-Amphidinium_carterae.1
MPPPEDAIALGGEFSQALADNRAQLVAERIAQHGVDPSKIFMEGVPGVGRSDMVVISFAPVSL